MLLIIDRSLKNAKDISDIFYYMGVLSYPITPERAVNEINNRYRAILITNAEKTALPDELLKMLKTYSLGAPIFALCNDKVSYLEANKRSPLIDEYFDDHTFSSSLFKSITKIQSENKKPEIGIYRLAGIDASVTLPGVTFYDEPIKLTKTETMIIRYLIRSFPAPVKASDILKHAFKISRAPDISNIRTHISVINKKFRSIFGKSLIINEARSGYTVLTPIKERELTGIK